MHSNIFDTALIFEGGGMRASYTAAVANTLLAEKMYFNYVAGISAGASLAVNYLSRDPARMKKSFVEIMHDKRVGGWGSFLRGKGFFSSDWIYLEMGKPDGVMPFDWNTFLQNPGEIRIGAFQQDTGRMVYWGKKEMQALRDLMVRVQASSSLPLYMPPVTIDGHVYVDGGVGGTGGIALDIAKQDGYKRFFIVRTRPKSYRRSPPKNPDLLRFLYRKQPLLLQALLRRHEVYNETLDEISKLEEAGQAYVFYPEVMPVENRERNVRFLDVSYRLGLAQSRRELPRWKAFLGFQ